MVGEDFFLVVADHVAFGDLGADLFLEDSSEFGHGDFVFGDKFFEQGSDFVEVDFFEVIIGESGVGKLYFVGFEVLDVLDGAGDECGD